MKNLIVGGIIALFLLGCGGSEENKPEQPPSFESKPEYSQYSVTASWWGLPQVLDGVPKYSGTVGTYTAKHIPSAVSCGLGGWAVYSNTNNDRLEVRSLDMDTGDNFLIHRFNSDDPHHNGAIQCLDDKLVVIAAAVGDEYGYTYESTNGEDWLQIEKHREAYPQMHLVGDDLVYLFSMYTRNEEADPSINKFTRTIYSSCNDEPVISEIGVGNYSLSYYDGEKLHIVYNKHPNGNVDKRYGLFQKSSYDGCKWSEETVWLDTDGLVYLKDINEVNGEITALVTLSTSYIPTQGERDLYKVTSQDKIFVADMNHNYTSAVIMQDGEIYFPSNDVDYPYAGGRFMGAEYANYLKRVDGDPDVIIFSEGISPEYDSDAWVSKVKLNKY